MPQSRTRRQQMSDPERFSPRPRAARSRRDPGRDGRRIGQRKEGADLPRDQFEEQPVRRKQPAIANNGDLEGGHLNHTGPVFPADDWGDIIPPYPYVDADGKPQTFPG